MTLLLVLGYLVAGAVCVVPLSAAALAGWRVLDAWLTARAYARRVETALLVGVR